MVGVLLFICNETVLLLIVTRLVPVTLSGNFIISISQILIVLFFKTRLTWFEARQACRYAGGELFVNSDDLPSSVIVTWLNGKEESQYLES